MNCDIFRKELCHISNPVGYPEILKHFKHLRLTATVTSLLFVVCLTVIN